MPQQLLDAADVGPAIQQVCGKAVPQRVRACARVEAGQGQVFFNETADAAGGQACAAFVQEHRSLRTKVRQDGVALGQPLFEGGQRLRAEKGQAFPFPFAAYRGQAAAPDLNFNWFDAAVLTERARQQARSEPEITRSPRSRIGS